MSNAEVKFIGRERELQLLNDLLSRRIASLVVIKGRRRIGKSRLVAEFAREKTFYRFSGLAPIDGVTAQHQRDAFALQLNRQTGLRKIKTEDWSELFLLLYERVRTDRVILFFDEITWMAQDDPSFLAKLQLAWELYYKNNSKLILILCGSISTWIEDNIMSSTGFFGRITQKITLQELPLQVCNDLLTLIGFKRSAYEKFLILSLTGGVPWYIELIDSSCSASDNIKRLCFTRDGILVEEHRRIFHDLFGKKSEIYKKITDFLATGSAEYKAISKGIGYTSSGPLSRYLKDLVLSGYIRREYSWSFKTGKDSKIVTYRLSDNYLRFYYKYIEPQINRIEKGQYMDTQITELPSWEAMMGLQFENLVLNNTALIHKILRIHPGDIVADNPYLQRETLRHKGCQIDYLIQTRAQTLFVCEIKFSIHEINTSIIQAMKEKIARLAVPKGYACMPVLIHINGVAQSVRDSEYFFQCIDFSEWML